MSFTLGTNESALLDSLESGHIIVDEELNILYWNRWLSINTLVSKDDTIGKNLAQLYNHINASTLKRKVSTAFLLKTPTFYNADSKTPFLPIKRNRVSGSSLEMMQQQIAISPYNLDYKIAMISIYDISEVYEVKLSLKKEIQKVNKLNQKLELQNEVIDKNIMMLKLDINGYITDASTLFCQFSEYTKNELINNKISIFNASPSQENLCTTMWESVKAKKSWSGEFQNITKNGILKWVHITMNPLLDDDDIVSSYTIFYYDITNKKILEELYIRDTLTGLYNRAYFDKTTKAMMEKRRAKDENFALIVVDIDFFKSINDKYGHQVGDEALKVVASTLQRLTREDDIVARWGGEEFVILLKNITKEIALQIAEKLRSSIEVATILGNLKLTSSFGVSMYISGEEIKETFKRADEALYEAKKSGRNRVVIK